MSFHDGPNRCYYYSCFTDAEVEIQKLSNFTEPALEPICVPVTMS